DLLPTVCTLAGVPVSEDVDGVSLFTADGSLTEETKPAAFIWYDPRHGERLNKRAGIYVRDRRYRLHGDGRFFDAGDPLDPAALELTGPLTPPQQAARDRLSAVLEARRDRGTAPPLGAAFQR
ncbi:MAG: hypothetical protein AAF907_14870, partial [Planctomycetota bacterium]